MAVVASHLGLAPREINVLSSLFSMLEGTSRSKMEVLFVDLQKNEVRKQPPDILFINQDDFESVYAWNALARQYPYTVPVFVCAKETLPNQGQYILKRPIMLRKIVSTIQTIANLVTKTLPSTPSIKQLSVLVVDDSFSVRKYMEHTLPSLFTGQLGLNFAVDGSDALNMMNNKFYDLVFLDVIMPGIDGYKVCKSIKSKHRAAVVMLSSKKSPFDRVRGTMSGCNAYITKPPSVSKLKKILDKCVKNHNK
ncbi:hypothetical protein MNBD_GAMMA12-644 [hydrothermal vent metagenome]|uniref:Response regulatory domain-containing protein n=1 Tax=hydrothermal vent metagenome TaxID=652676 RepID=A0A3B0YNM3_9ZZZZ